MERANKSKDGWHRLSQWERAPYVERCLRKCIFCPNGQIVEVCIGKAYFIMLHIHLLVNSWGISAEVQRQTISLYILHIHLVLRSCSNSIKYSELVLNCSNVDQRVVFTYFIMLHIYLHLSGWNISTQLQRATMFYVF